MNKFFLLICLVMLTLFQRGIAAENLTSPPQHQYIKVKNLYERLKKGEKIQIVDVRSKYAYDMEHIKGAISIPVNDVKVVVTAHPLSKKDLIVTYCSCPHHLAEMAFDLLKELGYTNVLVLDEGIPGWKRNNYPVNGSLANKPLAIYWVIGYVRNRMNEPIVNAQVRVYQPETQQLEIGNTGKDGFYALQLHFYGLKTGDKLQASLGNDVVFFSAGNKTEPWGVRVDDTGSFVEVIPQGFLTLFNEKKPK